MDDDSVDLSLVGKGYSGIVRNPQIDLQLKCTSQNLINGDTLKFPLKKKNYDDLRGDNVLSPRYLVVLVVPSADIDWLEHKDDHMVARNLCYWISIKDFPETTNDTSITLEIPITQRFNSTTLKNLMECASKRVDPC